MSNVNDIKNRRRLQKTVTPTQALSQEVEEKNVSSKMEKKVERKRVSFDLRTDLHKQLKMQSILEEKSIYLLIEEALEKYLSEK
ncbi:hypothetical protein [Niallia sp. 03133]|uniref:hypothetical protein n=1 Tax=Niallia sp. 03133 TaxID=3458060 RepID=UPI0040441F6F